MRNIKLLYLILSCMLLSYCSNEKKNEILFIKYLVFEKEVGCEKIKEVSKKNRKTFTIEQIYTLHDFKKNKMSQKKKIISKSIIEYRWKQSEGEFFAYTNKEGQEVLILYFKGVDDTELFFAKDKKHESSVCQILQNPEFVLNLLSEPTAKLYK